MLIQKIKLQSRNAGKIYNHLQVNTLDTTNQIFYNPLENTLIFPIECFDIRTFQSTGNYIENNLKAILKDNKLIIQTKISERSFDISDGYILLFIQ